MSTVRLLLLRRHLVAVADQAAGVVAAERAALRAMTALARWVRIHKDRAVEVEEVAQETATSVAMTVAMTMMVRLHRHPPNAHRRHRRELRIQCICGTGP